MDTSKVTRVEVIDHTAGIYHAIRCSNWNLAEVELSLQDDGHTLKIFVREPPMSKVD